jgi:hypothetical protein
MKAGISMSENQDSNDRLKNLYKIKEEIEKELEEKGIKIPQKVEKKKISKEVYKADYEIERLNVSINNLNNWFDIILNDIDISNEKLSYFFEIRLGNKSSSEHSNQFGLMHLFRNNFELAEKFFNIKNNDVNSFINKGFLKIIRKDEDVTQYFSELIKNYPKNGLIYLTLSLYFLRNKNFHKAYELIKVANNYLNYSFVNMGISAYEKEFQKSISFISKSYLEGKAKKIINLLNFYISLFVNDTERANSSSNMLKEVRTPCVYCIKSLTNSEVIKVSDFCSYYERILSHLGTPKQYNPTNSELYELTFYKFFQEKNIQSFNSYSKRIENSFDKIPLKFIPTTESDLTPKTITNLFYSYQKKGIKWDLKGPNYFENLNKVLEELKDKFHKNYIFILDLPFYESLRLLFGWRICQYINK